MKKTYCQAVQFYPSKEFIRSLDTSHQQCLLIKYMIHSISRNKVQDLICHGLQRYTLTHALKFQHFSNKIIAKIVISNIKLIIPLFVH